MVGDEADDAAGGGADRAVSAGVGQEPMNAVMTLNGRRIGRGERTYIVAEMSANHHQSFDEAVRLIRAAKESGADAVKAQTYTPDTITMDCDSDLFRIGGGSIWAGKSLYKLYGEAYTPWDWQPRLKRVAEDLGLDFFSTPFDETAVDFLEGMGVVAYKVSSFELVDLPLIRRVARTGKPLILSAGMGTFEEIREAVEAAREAGCRELALLKCTSAYPAAAAEMNLRTIVDLSESFGVPVGLSDHTLGWAVPVAAVAMGACIVEKHFTLSRSVPGPDAAFSIEPEEWRRMVDAVRTVEEALGRVSYEVSERERASVAFRRSLFVVRDMRAGEAFTAESVRSIRPGHGLHTRHLGEVIGRCASRAIARGTPLSWDMIG
jgi:N-acetylneuraminate synthase